MTAYTDITHPNAPPAYPALLAAREQIDILRSNPGPAWKQLLQLINAIAEQRCPTRILIHANQALHPATPDPDHQEQDDIIRQLAHTPRVTLGHIQKHNYETIIRADNQLFISIALGQTPYERTPYLHITRTTQDGMFDRFADYLNQEWKHAQPILLSTGQPPPPPDPPRRWPGRAN